MVQAGGAVIDPQERTETGASRDDLGAPFSLSDLYKERTYSPPARGQWWYCLTAVVRPPGRLRWGVLPCRYIPADANDGLCIGRSCVDALGALGPSATTATSKNKGWILPILVLYFHD